jgi:hypothetical protein
MAMNWQDLGKQVADFAPLLGTALGGPLGTGIGSIVASTFGTGNDPAQISQAINSDPDSILKLKEIELTHKAQLEQIALETTKAELDDKQNARQTHNQSKMPSILSIGLTLLIVLIIYLLFFQPIPEGAKEVLYMLLGVAVKEWGGAMQYWFGTTRSSSDKTKLLSTIKN